VGKGRRDEFRHEKKPSHCREFAILPGRASGIVDAPLEKPCKLGGGGGDNWGGVDQFWDMTSVGDLGNGRRKSCY